MKVFNSVKYLGGLSQISTPQNIDISVDYNFRRIFFQTLLKGTCYLNFEDIEEISLDEKSTRSVGKAAAGAIVGGLLTGGIGLLAGGALGARKKNQSTIYITYNKAEKHFDVLLKAKGQTEQLFASLSSAIATDAPTGFDYARTAPPPKTVNKQNDEKSNSSISLFFIFLVIIFIIYWISQRS